jgi:hypothetical protein
MRYSQATNTDNLRELENSQWYSRERLYRLQADWLGQLLLHASRKPPYYREQFGEIGGAKRVNLHG